MAPLNRPNDSSSFVLGRGVMVGTEISKISQLWHTTANCDIVASDCGLPFQSVGKSIMSAEINKKHLKNVRPIHHCEPPHAACFTLPFTRCRYCRMLPAHRCPQQHRQQ